MTKKEYWQKHVAKNPAFADEEKQIKISVKMLRLLMEEAFDKGFERHKETSKFIDDLFKLSGNRRNIFE